MRHSTPWFRRSISAVLVAVATSSAPANAQNVTVDFNAFNTPGSPVTFQANCFTTMGFRFTAVGVACGTENAFVVGDENSPLFGNQSLLLNDPNATAIDFAATNGAAFSLFSLGLAPFFEANTNVTLTGTILGGGTVMFMTSLLGSSTGLTTLTSSQLASFSNLTSVRVTASNEFGEPYVILDNLAVNVVPEPSTYALMAAGLMALGVVARRRRVVR